MLNAVTVVLFSLALEAAFLLQIALV